MPQAVNMAGSDPETDPLDPDSGMRVLGAVQINIGLLVFVLGVVDLILTMTSHDRDLKSYGSHYETVVTLTTVSCPLWSGLWFSIAGALAACFSYGRPTTVLYSKVALLVTSLLCCALFGPACAVISGFISYTRHNLAKTDYQWLISLVICFLAILEVVMATVTVSVMCCCSTFRPAQVHIFVNPRKLSSSGSDVSNATKSSTVSEKVEVSNFRRKNTRRINLINRRNSRNTGVAISRDLKDAWTQVSSHKANVGTSKNNCVQLFNQTLVKDTNPFPLQPTLLVVKDEVQLTPQTRVPPVRTPDEGGSLLYLNQAPAHSLGDHHASQLSHRSPIEEVIMRTPRQWISKTPVTNPSTESLVQHAKEASVKSVQSDLSSQIYPVISVQSGPSSHQYNSPPVSGTRSDVSTQGMTWTPDRHLKSQPPSLPTRPSSTNQSVQTTSSYQVLRRLALPQ